MATKTWVFVVTMALALLPAALAVICFSPSMWVETEGQSVGSRDVSICDPTDNSCTNMTRSVIRFLDLREQPHQVLGGGWGTVRVRYLSFLPGLAFTGGQAGQRNETGMGAISATFALCFLVLAIAALAAPSKATPQFNTGPSPTPLTTPGSKLVMALKNEQVVGTLLLFAVITIIFLGVFVADALANGKVVPASGVVFIFPLIVLGLVLWSIWAATR